MLKMNKSLLGLAALATVAVVMLGGSQRAEARDSWGGGRDRGGSRDNHHSGSRDHFSVGLRFGSPSYYAPSSGHYETRYETVLVEPARYERRWVPDVVETRRDHHGRTYTEIVRRGYWEEYAVPARYERRAVSVWVPGYYEHSRPRISVGGFFGF